MNDFFIADDLSGALDAAAAFHHAGRRVRIVLSASDWTASDGEIVGVTTETRNASPLIAASAVERAIAHGRAQGARLVYKKIDSTVRGPVAAEIGALARQLPGARILFTPANPGVGRTVRNGVLLVRGVPVSETEFARDPVSPVTESNLYRLLGDAGGTGLVVADAANEADLTAAVARMEAEGGEWVAVGSGALARPVAALGAGEKQRAKIEDTPAPPAGPGLMICGSAQAGNRAQAAALARERGIPVHELRISDPGPAIAAVIASLRAGGGASLLVEEARGASVTVLRILTAAAMEIIAATGTARLFATGGETAFALCGALGIQALRFGDELESGMSLSHAATERGPLLLAIKNGGFGVAETWVRAWDGLRAWHG
ncbi:MAG: four-carbon acid sugar kinase family protein [Opitutus sp.]|nr:four-carbon acid sugar kinase family protein [Opitutus sp.]